MDGRTNDAARFRALFEAAYPYRFPRRHPTTRRKHRPGAMQEALDALAEDDRELLLLVAWTTSSWPRRAAPPEPVRRRPGAT